MIYFVGAGPGAADLITVRGAKLLEMTDVVIYAGSLVSKEMLKYTGEKCKIYDSSRMSLGEIIAVMKDSEAAGLMTVRLHTGDPSLYGAIAEQMSELDKAGIEYEVCPGISAYQGAAASLKVEYTLPEISQTVILSRIEGKTPVPESESIKSLAAHNATMILYLSSGMAEKVKAQLKEANVSDDMPVTVVYKATWAEEKIIKSNVASFPEDMRREGIDKHAIIIIGRVLDTNFNYSKLYDENFETEFRKAKERINK